MKLVLARLSPHAAPLAKSTPSTRSACTVTDGTQVLFGEWVAALHSVRYTTLPGYFLAFDIYNKRTRSFASVDERDRRLRGMGIPVVRTLARRSFASKDELLALLEEQSAYADGFVEGSYLRIDDEGGNVHRGKIVRPDFIQGCGEGHWLSKEPVKNGVRPDLWLDAPWHAAAITNHAIR